MRARGDKFLLGFRAFLGRLQSLSVAIMRSDDLTGVYLSPGFMF